MQKVVVGTNISENSLSLHTIRERVGQRWVEMMKALDRKRSGEDSSQEEMDEANRLWEERWAKGFHSQIISPSLWFEHCSPDKFEFTFNKPEKFSIINLKKKVAYEESKEKDFR